MHFEEHFDLSPNLDRLSFVQELNKFLVDPEYLVAFFVRHAHAEQDGKKVDGQDKYRKLDERGIQESHELAVSLSDLSYEEVAFLSSSATRCEETAKAIEREITARNVIFESSDDFYHKPVKNCFDFLIRENSMQNVRHVFIVNHNSRMTKVFLQISGRKKAFIPTSGVMVLAIKAATWLNYYQDPHSEVHIFTSSPKGSEQLESTDFSAGNSYAYHKGTSGRLILPEE